jgi:hypothetical protein
LWKEKLGTVTDRQVRMLVKLITEEETLAAAAAKVGSHVVMVKTGTRVNLSIPQPKELSIGTLRKLISLSGMTVEEFLDLL